MESSVSTMQKAGYRHDMFRRPRSQGRDEGAATTSADSLLPFLYGNRSVVEWGAEIEVGDPWDRFAEARRAYAVSDSHAARRSWEAIVATPGLESRQYLQAWSFLRQVGHQPPADQAKRVLGVIAEMPMGQVHDVLAAYEDGSCRYLNHSGKVEVIEDAPLESVQVPARAWLETGRILVDLIGPWEEEDLPVVPARHMRVMVLTPSGPHFGQGPQEAMMPEAP